MTTKPGKKLDDAKSSLLPLLRASAVLLPMVLGLASVAQTTELQPAAMPYRFEVASIRPLDPDGMVGMMRMLFDSDSYSASNATVQMLIKDAYGIGDKQLVMSGLGVQAVRYEIEAKIDSDTMVALSKMSPDELKAAHQQMLRTLLAERFKLAVHWDEKELSVYSLEIAKDGPKLQEAKPGDTYSSGLRDRNGNLVGAHMMLSRLGGGQISGQGLPLKNLVSQLSGQLHELIVDKTGLKGTYDFDLRWTPERSPNAIPDETNASLLGAESASDPAPSLFTAIQEELGLKLQRTKEPVKVLVVDRLENPSEN